MKWVTRERPKIDRIACPWLIARFIDPQAEFLYVPDADVLRTAEAEWAIPYDIPGVEYGHHGERCSFDAFIDKHRLTDPALQRLAPIVRSRMWEILQLNPRKEVVALLDCYLAAVRIGERESMVASAAGLTIVEIATRSAAQRPGDAQLITPSCRKPGLPRPGFFCPRDVPGNRMFAQAVLAETTHPEQHGLRSRTP